MYRIQLSKYLKFKWRIRPNLSWHYFAFNLNKHELMHYLNFHNLCQKLSIYVVVKKKYNRLSISRTINKCCNHIWKDPPFPLIHQSVQFDTCWHKQLCVIRIVFFSPFYMFIFGFLLCSEMLLGKIDHEWKR